MNRTSRQNAKRRFGVPRACGDEPLYGPRAETYVERSPRMRLNARLDELMRLAPAHEAGVKLQRMIKRTRQYLFVFVTNRDIPATNNGSERALRPCVVFRKITNGFRTEWGAKLYADIRSVIETARRRSISALEAIRLALAGAPLVDST